MSETGTKYDRALVEATRRLVALRVALDTLATRWEAATRMFDAAKPGEARIYETHAREIRDLLGKKEGD